VGSCSSLNDTRASEIEGVGAVGFNVSSNGGVGLAFLRAEYLGTLEVGTTSTKLVIKKNYKKSTLFMTTI
jgi:hypothetical protein